MKKGSVKYLLIYLLFIPLIMSCGKEGTPYSYSYYIKKEWKLIQYLENNYDLTEDFMYNYLDYTLDLSRSQTINGEKKLIYIETWKNPSNNFSSYSGFYEIQNENELVLYENGNLNQTQVYTIRSLNSYTLELTVDVGTTTYTYIYE